MAGSGERSASPYQLFILVLCLGALGSLAVGSALSLTGEAQVVLSYADNVVCALFFADFLFTLYDAPRKWAYLLTWGWLDLLSSIPTLAALRWGRAARAFRILRVVRAVKSVRVLSAVLVAQRARSAFLAAVLLELLLRVFSSLAMLQLETGGSGTIRTVQDAMWWRCRR